MDKRGISSIVTSVLIILVSVVGVSLVWMVTSGIIDFDNRAMNTRVDVIVNEGYTVCDPDKEIMMVQVKRGADEETIENISLIFDFEGNSYSARVKAPDSNQVLTYSFNISDAGRCPYIVSAAPIFNEGNVEEIGKSGPNVKIPAKKISKDPAVLISIPDLDSDADDGGCTVDSECDDGDVCTLDSCVGEICSFDSIGVDCSDLIAWWRFEEDFDDETGNYDGTAVGSVEFVSSGVASRGFEAEFFGSDYVMFEDIIFSDDNNWTILYWSRADGYSRIAMGNRYDNINHITHMYNNNKVWVNSNLGGDYGYVYTGSSSGTLLHVAIRPNVTNDFDIYFDGVHDNEDFSLSSSEIVINSIGKGKVSGGDFQGMLDEVMIFNRSLSNVEITNLYSFFA